MSAIPRRWKNPHGVEPGQVWESLRPQTKARVLLVLRVAPPYAICERGGREARVLLRNFTPRLPNLNPGFKLMRERP
jgi:hypothetical protein